MTKSVTKLQGKDPVGDNSESIKNRLYAVNSYWLPKQAS